MVATLEKWGASCENGIYVGDEEGRYLDDVTNIVSRIKIMDTESGYGFLIDKPSTTIIAHKACNTFNIIVHDINDASGGLKEIMEKIQKVDTVATNMAAITEGSPPVQKKF